MLHRSLIFLQLTLLHLAIHVRAQSCFTLAGTTCSQWSTFAIPDTNATSRFPYSPMPLGFSTALSTYIDNQTAIAKWFKSYWGCSAYTGSGLRYRTSMLCAEIVSKQSNVKSCSTNTTTTTTTTTPTPLCRSTCMSYVASLSEILQNQTICPGNDELRRERWLALNNTCKSAPFNGTDGICVSGEANEPGTCGYTEQDICMLCINASSRNSCISDTPNTTNVVPFTSPAIPFQPSTPKTLIVALTVSLGSLLLLILIILVWMNASCRRHVRHLFSLPWTRRYRRPHHISTSTTEYTYTDTPSSARDYIVIHPYFERRPDELYLHQGGLVSIRRVYDDNWAYGVCSTTGQRGMFPLVCVSPVRTIANNTEKPASLMLGEQRASVGVVISKRTTSLAATRTAILRSSVDSTDSTVSSHHPHLSSLPLPSRAFMQDSHCGSTIALSSDGSALSPADSYHSDETLVGIGHAVEEGNVMGPYDLGSVLPPRFPTSPPGARK
ncbi:hypothetical protein BC937DRAFT_86365 [Endogone sp. FLAS-F59071]|nr:hypothetical protein BC937DRAFT_86365 [Endogone sp. FLAS-F59071]|eukprot:RUS13087.1 hypothetical protein BC937DRAFT_86365 [Endogone sp. FLAS-F59071]